MQITNVNSNNYLKSKRQSFKSLPESFLKMQENLSYTRFAQDTITNWVPKAVFTRSKEDLSEMSFLEFIESALFYFAPTILGGVLGGLIFPKFAAKLAGKAKTPANEIIKLQLKRGLAQNSNELTNNKFLSKSLSTLSDIVPKKEVIKNGVKKVIVKNRHQNLEKRVKELLGNKKAVSEAGKFLNDANLPKRLLPVKAAIVLGCVGIPAAEYALSFAKNLFTLKVFKKADFNNVVNLNKEHNEDKAFQDKVEKSAKSHIKKAAIVSAAALGIGLLFAAIGPKSKGIQKASEFILSPGEKASNGLKKLGVKANSGIHDFLKTYLNFDFDFSGGKWGLSKGQLAATVISGVFGYHKAAKDRGRLDELEMLSRVPLVAFYTIFGSSIFEKAFKSILYKNNIFPDLIKKNSDIKSGVKGFIQIPKLSELKLKPNGKKLIKQSAIVQAVPFIFSMAFMGFLLSGINRFWTQKRYDKTHGQPKNLQEVYACFIKTKNNCRVFKSFN